MILSWSLLRLILVVLKTANRARERHYRSDTGSLPNYERPFLDIIYLFSPLLPLFYHLRGIEI